MVVLLTVATLLASVLGEVAVIDEAGALVHDTPFALPLLDFSPFMRDEGVVVDEAPTAAQRETARELDQVARAHGFVALTRFGVDRALLQRAWNESAQLFALPPESVHPQYSMLLVLNVPSPKPKVSSSVTMPRPLDASTRILISS